MYLFTILLSAFFLGVTPMAQDASAAGSYEVKFETVADNCKGQGIELGKSTLAVSQNGKAVSVKVPELPTLSGQTGRKGKIRAEVTAATKATGGTARYGLNARISNSAIQGVFVAEFFKDDKPQCTQSFSLVGQKTKR